MTELATTRPTQSGRRARIALGASGVLLGVLLCLEGIALGLPRLAGQAPGYHFLPLGALLGAVIGLTRARTLLLWVPASALGLLLAVITYTPVMRRPVAALVRSDPIPARRPQAVVVLSGGITADGHLMPRAADRLLSGLLLIRRGLADTLVLSRERGVGPRSRVTSEEDQRQLIALLDRGVHVLVVDSVFSTRDEAVRMRALARPLGITRVAVVTSPTHTRRACATFEKAGFVVTCVPSESRDVAIRTLDTGPDRVRAFQYWLYELVGQFVYKRRGWV